MRKKTRTGRVALAFAAAVALMVPLLASTAGHAATTEALTVDLSSVRGPSTAVGEGFLYGISSDGTQPSDQYLQPLGITAFRGGGWFSGGWIKDNYQNGSATQADLNSMIAEAKRLTQPPYHAQYQALLSDIYGVNGGQPSNTMYPCDNGNCSNWVTFIDATVGALQASGQKFAYDIWNEPDISVFWTRGVASAQYFQMWDTAYREIRRLAPGALIVGPSAAYTPDQNPTEWNAFLSHTKAAGTVPDQLTNHDEGDGDDPVLVGRSIDTYVANNGLPKIPLSANEYQPADQQSAGSTAWYVARFAQSNYVNAMRGNWQCCITPNLTGILTQSGGTWQPTGNWWVLRDYADLTGSLVATNGQVGSTAISASEDSTAKRAVAVIGDVKGYTGAASVTFNGFGAVPWLTGAGSVNVRVDRIPDQAPLSAPQVVVNQVMSTSSGSLTVPINFQASHDAFAVYLTPAGTSSGGFPTGYHTLTPGTNSLCLDVYGATSTAGAVVDQWTCNGQTNQQFQFVPVSGGYGQLQARNSGLDVTVSGNSTAQGTPDIVQQAAGPTGGLWLPQQQSDGSWQFKNQNSGLCLDVYRTSSTAGQQLDQWPCKNAPGTNQDFSAH